MVMKRNAGGGYASNKVVRSTNHKTEPKPRAASPAAVSQIGSSMGNHVMERNTKVQGAAVPLYAGKGYATPKGPTECGAGPGAGRVIHKTGTQSMHGPASGERPSPGRPIDGPTPFANRKESY
jgi:hypothetical protein